MPRATIIPSGLSTPGEAAADVIEALDRARKALAEMVRVRSHHKLSFNRAAGVAREVADLIRVISLDRDELNTLINKV